MQPRVHHLKSGLCFSNWEMEILNKLFENILKVFEDNLQNRLLFLKPMALFFTGDWQYLIFIVNLLRRVISYYFNSSFH